MPYVKISDRTDGSLVDHPASLKENVAFPNIKSQIRKINDHEVKSKA